MYSNIPPTYPYISTDTYQLKWGLAICPKVLDWATFPTNITQQFVFGTAESTRKNTSLIQHVQYLTQGTHHGGHIFRVSYRVGVTRGGCFPWSDHFERIPGKLHIVYMRVCYTNHRGIVFQRWHSLRSDGKVVLYKKHTAVLDPLTCLTV